MAAEKDGVCGRGAQAPLAQKKLIPPKRICLVMIRRLAAAVVLCSLKPAAVLSFSLCTCLRSHDRIGVKVDLGLWTFACQRH